MRENGARWRYLGSSDCADVSASCVPVPLLSDDIAIGETLPEPETSQGAPEKSEHTPSKRFSRPNEPCGRNSLSFGMFYLLPVQRLPNPPDLSMS